MYEEVGIAQEKIERLVKAALDGRAEAAQISEREIALAILDPKKAQEKFSLEDFRKFLSVYDNGLKNVTPQIVTEQSFGAVINEFVNKAIEALGMLVLDCLSPFYLNMLDYVNAKSGGAAQGKQEAEKEIEVTEAKKESTPAKKPDPKKMKREKEPGMGSGIMAMITHVLCWIYFGFVHILTVVLIYEDFGTAWCVILSLLLPGTTEMYAFALQFITPGAFGGYWRVLVPLALGFAASHLFASASESEGGSKIAKLFFGILLFILFLAIAALIIWVVYLVATGILVYN